MDYVLAGSNPVDNVFKVLGEIVSDYGSAIKSKRLHEITKGLWCNG